MTTSLIPVNYTLEKRKDHVELSLSINTNIQSLGLNEYICKQMRDLFPTSPVIIFNMHSLTITKGRLSLKDDWLLFADTTSSREHQSKEELQWQN